MPITKRIANGNSYTNFRLVAEMPYELGGKGDADLAYAAG